MNEMKVPVLYGSPDTSGFQSSADYVAMKLGLKLEAIWDGSASVDFPPTRESIKQELSEFVPNKNLSLQLDERFSHSIGKSSPEILMARDSRVQRIVDAVIYPDYDNVSEILKELLARKYKAIIFGGGSSVSGSLLVGNHDKVVSIDTSNFRRMDLGGRYVVLGSGFTGMEAEEILNRSGYTIGNFPESMLQSTIGGWVATKAVGQESNQYGGIENLVLGTRVATSGGIVNDGTFPRKSSGFDYKDVLIGSDGKYGLITDVTLKLFRRTQKRYFSSYVFRSFKEGIDALSRSEKFPSVARLSDELETEFAFNTAGDSAALKLFRKYLDLRVHGNGALLVVVNNDIVVNPVLAHSISTGSGPAKSWIKGRYSRPGIANILWKSGLVPDTLETSTTWNNLYHLYSETRKTFYRLRNDMEFSGEIMAHVSHLYSSGACIYFTFILKSEDDMETLSAVRDGLIRTFISNGGSVTHHHGKGYFFSRYMKPDLKDIQLKLEDRLFTGGMEYGE